ncbi:50S ribosomal protein L4 [Nitrospira sp.]|nr:50S ribosomal protein L4 [Nitrospira sp.]
MPSVDVVDSTNRKVSTAELSSEVFSRTPNGPLVHEAVVMQRAGERQGTASTLRRGEVRGSGKKPWKQKHTGRARAGSVRSPIWRHGGSVFGPKPRSYGFSIPKGKYHRAIQTALSAKLSAGELVVVSDLGDAGGKTGTLEKLLLQLGVTQSVLIIPSAAGVDVIRRAAKNLSGVKVVTPEQVNVYDLLKYRSLVIAQPALERLQEIWV